MKKQLFGLLPLLLGLPLLGNATQDPRLSFFSIPTYKVQPSSDSMTNLSRCFWITVNEDCYLRVTLLLLNDNLRGQLVNPTNDPEVTYKEGYVLVGTSKYARQYRAGERFYVLWSYPASKLLDFNTVNLTVEAAYSSTDANPHRVILGFPAMVIH